MAGRKKSIDLVQKKRQFFAKKKVGSVHFLQQSYDKWRFLMCYDVISSLFGLELGILFYAFGEDTIPWVNEVSVSNIY